MSFLDLATITMHRRNELEGRLHVLQEKCDRAIDDIKKLKLKTQGFVLQLNCEPNQLKDRFLTCMKQLDEYMYLITDFNLAIGKIEEEESHESLPVQDFSKPLKPTPVNPYNLLDALSEPRPSTSTACSNHCPPEKPKRLKVPKADQRLIVFSSSSSSEEAMQQLKSEPVTKQVQSNVLDGLKKIKVEDDPAIPIEEECNLPAQELLQMDGVYEATIMHTDGGWIWLITDDADDVQSLMMDMTKYYSDHHKDMSIENVKKLTCCAFYDDDSDCYYRGLFLRISEEDPSKAVIFSVDTGEIRSTAVNYVQPLVKKFCNTPPHARCCFLAGVDFLSNSTNIVKEQEDFMRGYVGTQCSIEIDDNASESLGVYVVLPSGETINEIVVKQGLAVAIDKHVKASGKTPTVVTGPPPSEGESEVDIDITDCPEYEDPVVAVTGYHNRDEADICKHYKGNPEKTCFKGSRCTKKHIVKHPDGWTLDRTEVLAKCKSVPLPAPDTWHKVLVTCVCHYDRVYVQFVKEKDKDVEPIPEFGVVLPPSSLAGLVRDMNSAATRCAYKPLTMPPAPGELVAALYPMDGSWYRARVLSVDRAGQSVEVLYVDYGTILWVKEDQIRQLDARHAVLPMQAVRCLLAGVSMKSTSSQQWAAAKTALSAMVQDQTLDAHIISREYDEVVIELFDAEGYSVAEQLAALNLIQLTQYLVVDDTKLAQKLVVP